MRARMRSFGRWGSTGGAVALAAAAAVAVLGPSIPAAQAAVGDATVTFTDPGEHPFTVPTGVSVIHVDAVGAQGQTSPLNPSEDHGGMGGEVSGSLAVTPGQGLYVEVGVGGGSASSNAGAGGGASAIEKCPASASFCANFASALNSRYLVAAGGGGAGIGASGGDAGAAGSTPGSVCSGAGGTAGGDSAGGTGGAGGDTAANGADGQLGSGGAGGWDGQDFHPGGGGGGGGWYGGGGGGGGSCGSSGAQPWTGGGGGGSNYLAYNVSNPTSGIASSSAPSVTITYTDHVAPTVTLTGPASGQTVGASPTFAGAAGHGGGDSDTVSIAVYAGGSAGGSPVTTVTAQRDSYTGGFSANPSAPLPNGTYTAQASQTDAAGNAGTSDPVTFTVYEPAPAVAPGPTPGGTAAGASGPHPASGSDPSSGVLGHQATRCVVPGVVGLTLARARARLAAAGCRVGRVSRRHAPQHGAVVVRQGSRRGTRRARGSRVTLVLGAPHRHGARHRPR